MKISFCVPCMNRTWHIQKTLRGNIKCAPTAEFVLLDYGSKEPLRPWILSEFPNEIQNGRLLFLETDHAQYRPAHALNVVHSWATGDLLCDLNADSVLSPYFVRDLTEEVKKRPDSVGPGLYPREAFRSAGGFDEDLDYGWGSHKQDLLNRLKAIGYVKTKKPVINEMPHDDDLRICNINFDKIKSVPDNQFLQQKLTEVWPSFQIHKLETYPKHVISGYIHKIMSDYNIKKGNLTANKGKYWAEAIVVVNAKEKVNSWMYEQNFFKL